MCDGHRSKGSLVRLSALGAAIGMAVGIGLAVARANAADDSAKLTIKQIMEKAHKGRDAVVVKVRSGKGTPEEISTLLGYYKMMEELDPPKGDPAKWKTKVHTLVLATEALQSGEDGAVKKFAAAVNCGSCHSTFRKREQ